MTGASGTAAAKGSTGVPCSGLAHGKGRSKSAQGEESHLRLPEEAAESVAEEGLHTP